MYTSLLTEILALLLGRKYWANIIHLRGTAELSISCFIFQSKEQAMAHSQQLASNKSYEYVETISFRSRTLPSLLP